MAASGLWARDDSLILAGRLPRWAAGLTLAAVAALIALGLFAALASSRHTHPTLQNGADAQLYRRMVEGVARGGGYYQVAPAELRRGHFPLRPFLAVRPPLLTMLLARLPGPSTRFGLLVALAGVCFASWAYALRTLAAREPLRYAAALVLLAGGLAPILSSTAYLFHEVWAGMLVSTSLALYTPRRWAMSLALGLAAALLRELAAPYLLVMAAFALMERRRGEAAAWIAALAVFAAALAGHAAAAAAVTTTADLRSPGWLGLGGWPFALRTLDWNAFVLEGPVGTAALLAPFAVLGLACWRGARGRRAGAVALGYMAGFCVVGRHDNAYWGLLIAPLWPLGLAFADPAVRALLARDRTAPRAPAAPELAPDLAHVR
jgi:hypothetical protein